MAKMMKPLFMVILLAFVLGTLGITGCTRYANQDQLKTLDETQAAAVSAEKQLADKKNEKATLEKDLAAKKAELEKVKAEKETVKQRLSKVE